MKRPFVFFVFVVHFVIATTVEAGDSRRIVDMVGRELRLPGSVRRIVCLGPGALRLVVYLGVQDRVCAVEDMEKHNPVGRPYWMAHPELARLPSCGPGGPAAIGREPEGEKILALRPDLLLVTMYDRSLADRVQRRLRLPVVVLDCGTFGNYDPRIWEALRFLGEILGRKDRADAVVAFMERELGDLRTRRSRAEGSPPRPYVGGIGYRGTQGLGSTELDYAPFRWLDLRHAASELPRRSESSHLFLGWEALLALNPVPIFVDGGGIDVLREEGRRRARLQGALRAFRGKEVYRLHPYNWYLTNVGTALVDAWTVGRILFPGSFGDVDLRRKADEIYRFLVGHPVVEAMASKYGRLGAPYGQP